VDREAVQWLLAILGVVASSIGVVEFLWPDAAALVGPWWIVVMVLIGIAVGTAYRLLKRSVRAASKTGSWEVEIVPGNVLDYRPCVLTTDRRRSYLVDNVAPTSLIAQFLDTSDEYARAELKAFIASSGRPSLTRPGDVLILETSAGLVILLACGKPTDRGTVTTWSHLTQAYDGLWNAIRSRHLEEVSIPVIGAGFSRVSLSHQAVLLALLLSYHAASAERLVCRRLRIVVPPSEVDQDELVRIRRFLAALSYSIR
jgi:hypothetical protein